jgi:hypothetical protein
VRTLSLRLTWAGFCGRHDTACGWDSGWLRRGVLTARMRHLPVQAACSVSVMTCTTANAEYARSRDPLLFIAPCLFFLKADCGRVTLGAPVIVSEWRHDQIDRRAERNTADGRKTRSLTGDLTGGLTGRVQARVRPARNSWRILRRPACTAGSRGSASRQSSPSGHPGRCRDGEEDTPA